MTGLPRTAAAIALSMLTGCASVVNGPTQSVGVSSVPPGATVRVDGVEVGRTPLVAEIDRRAGHVVSLSKPPFGTRELTLSRSTSAWVLGNALFGYFGLIGLGVDAATGGLYRLYPPALDATLSVPPGPASAEPDAPVELDEPDPALATIVPKGPPERRPAVGDGAAPRVGGTAAPAPAPHAPPPRSRREGLFVGAALGASTYLPLPLPIVELGYEFDRLGVRARIGALFVGRWALETSWALDAERRTRAYLTVGLDNALLDAYEFVGVGLERRLGRGDWFAQLDVTDGGNDDRFDGGNGITEAGIAAGLSVGLRR